MNTLVACAKCEKLNRVPLDKASAAVPLCGSCGQALPYHDGVQDVSATGLSKLVTKSEVPVVVDFWAEWCGPCRSFAPTFKAAAAELAGRFVFAKLDTEASPMASQSYRIRGIPTLIVFKGGVEVDRQSGAMPLPMFRDYLRRFL